MGGGKEPRQQRTERFPRTKSVRTRLLIYDARKTPLSPCRRRRWNLTLSARPRTGGRMNDERRRSKAATICHLLLAFSKYTSIYVCVCFGYFRMLPAHRANRGTQDFVSDTSVNVVYGRRDNNYGIRCIDYYIYIYPLGFWSSYTHVSLLPPPSPQQQKTIRKIQIFELLT